MYLNPITLCLLPGSVRELRHLYECEHETCIESYPPRQITFKKQATNETVKKCYKPMVQMCDGEPAGSREFDPDDPDVICKTVFESECTTRYMSATY